VRTKLAEIDGKRGLFTGTLARFGQKKAYKGPPIKTALLRDVKNARGEHMTDHLWFKVGLQMERLNLQPGDEISFEARVTPYIKGYRGRRDDDDLPPLEKDYRLSFPRNFKKLSSTSAAKPQAALPLFDQVEEPACHANARA
jgi:hypothetical protein